MNNLEILVTINIVAIFIIIIWNEFFKWRASAELKKVINNS